MKIYKQDEAINEEDDADELGGNEPLTQAPQQHPAASTINQQRDRFTFNLMLGRVLRKTDGNPSTRKSLNTFFLTFLFFPNPVTENINPSPVKPNEYVLAYLKLSFHCFDNLIFTQELKQHRVLFCMISTIVLMSTTNVTIGTFSCPQHLKTS